MTIKAFRDWFDPIFIEYLHQKQEHCVLLTERAAIRSSIEQVILLARNGKRVRPYLALLSYEALGGKDKNAIVHVLIALELFHTFCLIHDDVIDEDEMRRGEATIHAMLANIYQSQNRSDIALRAANAQAILVGDLVFSWVFEALVAYGLNGDLAKEFFHTVDEVVIGQMIDVDLIAQDRVTREDILEKMRKKTAGYTFVQPLRIGRLLAGQSARDKDLDEMGLSLGLAFQMQDDLFDLYASEEDFGKDIGSDIMESQHTLLTQYVFDHGKEEDVKELCSYMGQDMDEEKIMALRTLFDRAGASSALRTQIEEQIQKAQVAVDALAWKQEQREILKTFITYVADRQG